MMRPFDRVGLASALRDRFGERRVRIGLPLAPWTTFRLGGPGDVVFEPESLGDVRDVLEVGRRFGAPLTILGGGSNVLVADAGVRGLVLRLRLRSLQALASDRVRAECGVTMNGLVRWTIARGLGGIETWAGTPGTVGGAVYGNAHFGGRLIAELIERVELLGVDGNVAEVPADAMGFGYDRSRVQSTGEIVVASVFRLEPDCGPETLRRRARESLATRKRTQPLDAPSAGCVFQNPVPGRDRVPEGVPWSAGALVDRAGLKGCRVGGAFVSPAHANFIVTGPGARAADVKALVRRCQRAVHDAFGVDLREEIRYLGDFGGD